MVAYGSFNPIILLLYENIVFYTKIQCTFYKICTPNQHATMIFDKKAELNVLINLAASDTNVAARESKLIHTIGEANGISKADIDTMLKNPKPIGRIDSLTPDEKFEHLYHLIQLMKMDGQVFRSEMFFVNISPISLGSRRL